MQNHPHHHTHRNGHTSENNPHENNNPEITRMCRSSVFRQVHPVVPARCVALFFERSCSSHLLLKGLLHKVCPHVSYGPGAGAAPWPPTAGGPPYDFIVKSKPPFRSWPQLEFKFFKNKYGMFGLRTFSPGIRQFWFGLN